MDILGLIPTLGKAIMGDFGGAINEGLKAFGLTPKGNTTEDKKTFDHALNNASPDQLAKLKEIDANYKIKMKEMDVDLEAIFSDDRDSARRRQVEMKDYTPSVIGIGLILGFFGLLSVLLFKDVPTANETVLNILLGSLGTMATGVVTYYFGSSASSSKKDEKIAKMTY